MTYKECRAEGDVQNAMFSLPMCTIGRVRMCMCVCVCVYKYVCACVHSRGPHHSKRCRFPGLRVLVGLTSSDSEGGGGSREPRRDRSFVMYVWSKATHSCIHSFVYFLRREGGGFPSRMLTRWMSVKDDQGGASNSLDKNPDELP